jgi:hypothetical protein
MLDSRDTTSSSLAGSPSGPASRTTHTGTSAAHPRQEALQTHRFLDRFGAYLAHQNSRTHAIAHLWGRQAPVPAALLLPSLFPCAQLADTLPQDRREEGHSHQDGQQNSIFPFCHSRGKWFTRFFLVSAELISVTPPNLSAELISVTEQNIDSWVQFSHWAES